MDVGGTSLCIMVTHQLPTPRSHSRPPHIIMWNMSKHHIIMMQSHPVSVWIQRCALNPPSATHTLLYTANYPKCYLCEVYDFADFAATRSISVDVKVSDVLFWFCLHKYHTFWFVFKMYIIPHCIKVVQTANCCCIYIQHAFYDYCSVIPALVIPAA